jgi:hypothetical protein
MGKKQLVTPMIIILLILMGAIYLWFVSVGTWTQLSKTSTYYYRMQADGFLAMSPALLIEPDPRLAQLDNPYPAENRQNIPILMDASYYKGKYYLYYGPAPALALASFMFLFKRPVSDGYFTLISAWLIFTFSALLITKIWLRHFPYTPVWLVATALVFTGTMYPLMWGVNSARIYEAATLTCNAFVLAGLFFAFDTIDGKSPKSLSLIAAGLLWSFALGSRLLSLVVIAVLCFAIIIRLFWSGKRIILAKPAIINLLALLAPIGLTLILLGWYNFVRFGNPLETGLRYSLIGIKGVSSFYDKGGVFNFRYFLPNFVNYLFNPPAIIHTFPYINNSQASNFIYKAITQTEIGYYREGITGLLISMPFLIFCGAFLWFSVEQLRRKGNEAYPASVLWKIDYPIDLIFSIATIGIAGLAGFMMILVYYVVTTRFLLDFISLLNIVAISGMWILYNRLGKATVPQRILSVLVVIAVIYSSVISFLLAITGELNRFQNLNPGLYDKIARFFS